MGRSDPPTYWAGLIPLTLQKKTHKISCSRETLIIGERITYDK
jgi:hypothetical protein